MKGLARGQSSREIAEMLGISFHTVETHRKSLLAKFKTHSTVQMMLKATRMFPSGFWV
jgi:DNA-binding CsgD family transcriptional regulator